MQNGDAVTVMGLGPIPQADHARRIDDGTYPVPDSTVDTHLAAAMIGRFREPSGART
ncbi:hypothetical protein [Nonomuraea sp. LPB2021202275-12-8]|uniref:hypothetical protein n=1 Tax=Nonomuraea sp. LPB2021202275-12-8 TaxID=3120159 RepID=UPI00300D8CFE